MAWEYKGLVFTKLTVLLSPKVKRNATSVLYLTGIYVCALMICIFLFVSSWTGNVFVQIWHRTLYKSFKWPFGGHTGGGSWLFGSRTLVCLFFSEKQCFSLKLHAYFTTDNTQHHWWGWLNVVRNVAPWTTPNSDVTSSWSTPYITAGGEKLNQQNKMKTIFYSMRHFLLWQARVGCSTFLS